MSKNRNVESLTHCRQCGICQVACNNVTLVLSRGQNRNNRPDNKGRDWVPRIIAADNCRHCANKRCLAACPATGSHKSPSQTFAPGPVERVVAGHARDPQIQQGAASGGFVSALLRHLLMTGYADSCLTVVADPADPRKGIFRLIDKSEDLVACASSRYAMIPLQKAAAEQLCEYKGKRLVFVGRPCQTQGLQRLAKVVPTFQESIKLTISLFCAWSVNQSGVDFLVRTSGVRNEETIDHLEYRAGRWPGNFEVHLKSGVKAFPHYADDHFSGVYYYPALTRFIPKACLSCFDVLGEKADIAVGDAWNLGLAPVSHGYSLVICRTARAAALLQDNRFLDQHFQIDRECTIQDLETSQGNTVRLKKSQALGGWSLRHLADSSTRLFIASDALGRLIVAARPYRGPARWLLAAWLRLFWSRFRKRIVVR